MLWGAGLAFAKDVFIAGSSQMHPHVFPSSTTISFQLQKVHAPSKIPSKNSFIGLIAVQLGILE
jgi:hypothetical protein